MALVVLVSAKGAPGVTTLTVALAALTPGAVAADLDPDGGDLGLRYRRPDGAPLDTELGLLSLVAGLRRDQPGHRWLPPADDDSVPEGPTRLEDHLQVTGGGLDLLLGVNGPEQAAGLGPLWSPLARALSEAGRTVYADCGRVGPLAPTMPVLHQADAVIVVARPELEELAHLRERLRFLNSAVPGRFAGRAQIGVVLVAPERDRAVAGRTEQLLHSSGVGVPVLGTMALDQRGAEALRGMNRSRLARSTLIRSVRSLLPSVSLLAGSIPELSGAPVRTIGITSQPQPRAQVQPPAEEEVSLFAEPKNKVVAPPSLPAVVAATVLEPAPASTPTPLLQAPSQTTAATPKPVPHAPEPIIDPAARSSRRRRAIEVPDGETTEEQTLPLRHSNSFFGDAPPVEQDPTLLPLDVAPGVYTPKYPSPAHRANEGLKSSSGEPETTWLAEANGASRSTGTPQPIEAPTELIGTSQLTNTPQPGPTGTQHTSPQPSAMQPTGTQPTAVQLTGTQLTGTVPTGTQPTAVQLTGTQPTGTVPTGTQPTGTQPTGTTQPTEATASEEPAATIRGFAGLTTPPQTPSHIDTGADDVRHNRSRRAAFGRDPGGLYTSERRRARRHVMPTDENQYGHRVDEGTPSIGTWRQESPASTGASEQGQTWARAGNPDKETVLEDALGWGWAQEQKDASHDETPLPRRDKDLAESRGFADRTEPASGQRSEGTGWIAPDVPPSELLNLPAAVPTSVNSYANVAPGPTDRAELLREIRDRARMGTDGTGTWAGHSGTDTWVTEPRDESPETVTHTQDLELVSEERTTPESETEAIQPSAAAQDSPAESDASSVQPVVPTAEDDDRDTAIVRPIRAAIAQDPYDPAPYSPHRRGPYEDAGDTPEGDR